MKWNHLFLSNEVKIFPTHEVRAIGLKLAGSPGAVSAAGFGMSQTTASFHTLGTERCSQH